MKNKIKFIVTKFCFYRHVFNFLRDDVTKLVFLKKYRHVYRHVNKTLLFNCLCIYSLFCDDVTIEYMYIRK